MPPQARISHVKFSPDGSHLVVPPDQRRCDRAVDRRRRRPAPRKAVVTGADRINATTGDPCDWLKDNVTMVCELVPAGRGPAPAEPLVPSGPHVEENYGKAAPAPTYEDLLKTAHDDTLFDYYFTSQLAAINTATGAKTPIGKPAVFGNVTPAPGGQHRAGDEDQEAVLAHRADERLRAGRRDLDARRRGREEDRRPAVARRHDAHRRRDRAARLPLARRSAGDDPLGRSARRRRSEEQGAVPRQGRRRSPRRSRASRSRSRRPSGATAASTTPTPASRC